MKKKVKKNCTAEQNLRMLNQENFLKILITKRSTPTIRHNYMHIVQHRSGGTRFSKTPRDV